jgi:beta-xylosidase
MATHLFGSSNVSHGEDAEKKGASGAVFTYQNPNPQLEFRDTHIVPDNGKFYAVGTCPPYWDNKPKPNPGVKLFSSDNLKDWKYEGLLIDAEKLPADAWYKDRFWAPELRKIQGKYYLTFNCQNESREYEHFHGCGMAVADKIIGPYRVLTESEPIIPFPSNDMTLFEDEDRKVYTFFNNGWTDVHHIYAAEIDLTTAKLKEEPVLLFSQEPGKWDGGGIEGSHVVKNEGTYYLFYSSWTRGYEVGYATATNIRGPWKKYEKNPLFGAKKEAVCVRYGEDVIEDKDFPYTHVGHNAVFLGPDGRYWISCHTYQKEVNRAYMLMDPFWFEDGEIRTVAPTYTPQRVKISPEMLKAFPGLASK